MAQQNYTIGFANVNERVRFAIAVREGLETAAAEHPNLTLVVRNNDENTERALAHVREFAAIPVDLAIVYHVDERAGPDLRGILAQQGIPVISVSFRIPLTVYFAVDFKKAGLLAGEALGRWVQANWGGQVDKVLVMADHRIVTGIRQTLEQGLNGLSALAPVDRGHVFYVDGETDRQVSARRAAEVLTRWTEYQHIAAICINDESALGVLDAARALGRESHVAVIGQNASLAFEELKNPDTRLIASVAYHPEQYGSHLIDLALRMLNGERVPNENYLEPVCITADSVR